MLNYGNPFLLPFKANTFEIRMQLSISEETKLNMMNGDDLFSLVIQSQRFLKKSMVTFFKFQLAKKQN